MGNQIVRISYCICAVAFILGCAATQERSVPVSTAAVFEAAVTQMRLANPVQATLVLAEGGFRFRRDSTEAFLTLPAGDLVRLGEALNIPIESRRRPCEVPAQVRMYSADAVELRPDRASVWVTGTEASSSTWMTISALVQLEYAGGTWKAASSVPMRFHGECP